MKFLKALVILSFVWICSACASDPNEAVKGVWELTKVNFELLDGGNMNKEQKLLSEKLSNEIIADQISIEFKEGGIYEKSIQGDSETGEYSAVELDGDIQILLVNDDISKGATKMTVDDISEKEMKVTFDVDEKMEAIYTYTKK